MRARSQTCEQTLPNLLTNRIMNKLAFLINSQCASHVYKLSGRKRDGYKGVVILRFISFGRSAFLRSMIFASHGQILAYGPVCAHLFPFVTPPFLHLHDRSITHSTKDVCLGGEDRQSIFWCIVFFLRHRIWPGEASTVQWKWSPARPWLPPGPGSLKALLFPPLLNNVKNKGTQGVRARYGAELPLFISFVRYPGRPVILGMDSRPETLACGR